MAITPQTNATLSQIADALRAGDDFVICGHVSPDGDCLGSQLALWHALRALGKNATCVLVRDEPVAASLSFMPGMDSMVPAAAFEGACRVFVGVDVPSRERAGEAACALRDASELSVTIDHHAADERMCDLAYVDPDSASASIIVWEVVKLLCAEPPVESALCALTGLVTDTGGFRYQNADARAFAVASELVALGIDIEEISMRVFQNRTMAALKLEAAMIGRMHLVCGGAGALSWVTAEDFRALNAQKSDAEELVNALRSLAGVRVACMLREQDDVVRGSLRAKDATNVAALARKHGGGGHRAAAGFTLHMTLEEARTLMTAELEQLLAGETA